MDGLVTVTVEVIGYMREHASSRRVTGFAKTVEKKEAMLFSGRIMEIHLLTEWMQRMTSSLACQLDW